MIGAWLSFWQLQPDANVSREPWVVHTAAQGESVQDVARRYGVTTSSLRGWNPQLGELTPRQRLRVKPNGFVRFRQRRRTWLQNPVTWEELALRFDVTVEQLKQWNPAIAKRRAPPHRRTVVVWVESGLTKFPYPWKPVVAPVLSLPDDALSVGRPTMGRLRNGVALPTSPQYTVRIPEASYGSSLTIESVIQAMSAFRQRTGFEGPLYIGALSRRRGRRLPPHRSHQSGRDVDIRLPALPPAYRRQKLSSVDVDWFATFVLLDALERTGNIDVIFVDGGHNKRLRRAAVGLGVPPERIDAVMSRLSDASGHRGHLHVRFRCSAQSPECAGEHRASMRASR